MKSGVVIAVTRQAADLNDTTTVHQTLTDVDLAVAELHLYEEPKVNTYEIEEVVTDKSHHSGAVLEQVGVEQAWPRLSM